MRIINDQPIFRQCSISMPPKNFTKPGALTFSGGEGGDGWVGGGAGYRNGILD